jgi:hypothetical protein
MILLPDFLQMMGQGARPSNGQTDSCGGTCLNHLSRRPKIHVPTPSPTPPPALLSNAATPAGFSMVLESPAVSPVLPAESSLPSTLEWSKFDLSVHPLPSTLSTLVLSFIVYFQNLYFSLISFFSF